MAASSAPWQPKEEGFREICGLLEQQISHSSSSADKSQIWQQLQQYSQFPDFNNYLAFIFARAEELSAQWEESVNHLLLHCETARALWCAVFSRLELAWVMPETVMAIMACWNSIRSERHIRAVWKMIPICIMWCLWLERNERTFEDNEKTKEELIAVFFRTLCTWSIAVNFNGMDLHDFLAANVPSR